MNLKTFWHLLLILYNCIKYGNNKSNKVTIKYSELLNHFPIVILQNLFFPLYFYWNCFAAIKGLELFLLQPWHGLPLMRHFLQSFIRLIMVLWCKAQQRKTNFPYLLQQWKMETLSSGKSIFLWFQGKDIIIDFYSIFIPVVHCLLKKNIQ